MAVDLVSLVSQILTPQLVGSLARAVGVNEAVAQKLVSAAIPVVLGALATTAAAPGGAQKLVDSVSNSDPDLLTKLKDAIGGGNVRALSDGASMLGGLLGGSGLSSLCRRLEPIFRRDPSCGAIRDWSGHTVGDRAGRPAGPVQLVGSVVDRRDVRFPEECDRGGDSA